MAIDPYVYPFTNVLRNLLGIEDIDRLRQFEAVSTAHRISELTFSPISGLFDLAHLSRMHRYIFQDVFAWAGRFRTVDLRKEGGFWFCRHEFIRSSLTDLFDRLNNEGLLKSTTPVQFGMRAGHYMGEINAIHPFRDGNGRTQREFIRVLGLNAGLKVDWSRVTQQEMSSVSIAGFRTGDHRLLGELISGITTVLG